MEEKEVPREVPREAPPEKRAQEILREGQSSLKNLLPKFGLGILVLIFVLVIFKFILPRLRGLRPQEVTLTYWGLWEPETVTKSVIDQFEKEHPRIKIKYSQKFHQDYREKLQSALAREEGPDIFRFHNTWLPMFKNSLAPVPADLATSLGLATNFYPLVSSDLKREGRFYGVPLMFDTLALFVNSEIFETAGQRPPQTWDELRKTAIDLTVYDREGNIKTAGVALGETANVDHWSDVLGLMMLQNGADLSNPTGKLAEDALTFYTLFSTTDRVWDKTLPPSTYAFAIGKVAMYFAPSWRVFNIQEINPNLSFEIVPAPQLPGNKISWGTYWVEGVSKKSKHQKEAFEFLKFLAQKETMKKLHSEESKVRLFGEIPPRSDLAGFYQTNPQIAPFLEQASYAQSWFLSSRTWDNGINEKMIKYFEDAVNAVLEGEKVEKALETASQGVSQVLSQYQVSD